MASIMVNPFQNVFILLFPVHTRNHYLLATIVSQRYFLNNETWKLKLLLHAVFSSVQFSHSVVSDSLRPHELQHARPLCPSPTPGVHSELMSIKSVMPSSHLIICRPLLLLPPIPPASEAFPMSQLFAWGGQSTGASALASFLPKNTQDRSPLEWTGWISLQSKGLSRVFSNTTVQKHQFFGTQPSSQSNFHIHTWPQGKA